MPSDYEDDRYDDNRRGPDYFKQDRRNVVITRAKDAVRAPAIIMMVLGIICILAGAVLIAAISHPELDTAWEKSIEDNVRKQKMDPKEEAEYRQIMKDAKPTVVAVFTIGGTTTIAIGLLQFIAGIMVQRLKGRAIGYLSAILMIIPINMCCFGLVPLAIGIWMIVALGRADVKEGFAAVESERNEY